MMAPGHTTPDGWMDGMGWVHTIVRSDEVSPQIRWLMKLSRAVMRGENHPTVNQRARRRNQGRMWAFFILK